MRRLTKFQCLLAVSLMAMGAAVSLRGQAVNIYSNSVNDLHHRFNPGRFEAGDQIVFAGAERNLTLFDFEYWGVSTENPNLFTGRVEARVRFYLNDGLLFNGYPTPSTVLFDSDWFGVAPTERDTLFFTTADFGNQALHIPGDEITWSVQFRGMEASDTVGVDLYSPPTVGQNYDDYWENGSGGWRLLTNSVPVDFAARFYAVPEPSSLVLSLTGGLGILVLVRRLRRAE